MDPYVILEQYCPGNYNRFRKISHISLDKHLNFYSYDQIIFRENSECKTCHMLKPARSKHCKYCLSCISRYDHHCFLLNNCIGGYNHIYYLVFIYTNIIITFHSNYITSRCLYNIIKYENLLKATFINQVSKDELPNSYLTIALYLFSKYSPTFSLFMISLLCLPLLILLFLRDIFSNFCLNITNNEKTKYNNLKGNSPVNRQFYNKGFIRNVQDVFFYKKNVENFFKKNS
ncbi:palmitoyltransferase [Plasmodium gonderi]|uniref:Palmitoyltransferase n=1 Tax=Plasmodium gonderi TaxID=77519 RepID=A0A1Y1JBF3_PLAGO|nr:palmitoyltransferase [Plasmodium gonderi]GAW79580.1 palmitoyltransferase [Plasmodium gonderi]